MKAILLIVLILEQPKSRTRLLHREGWQKRQRPQRCSPPLTRPLKAYSSNFSNHRRQKDVPGRLQEG